MESVEEPRLDFARVYQEHAPHVRRMLARRGVRPEDLDDVLQETFVTVHRLLPSFEGRASLSTWLHSVSWRVAAGYRRRAHSRHEITGADEQPAAVADRPAMVAPSAGVHLSIAQIEDEPRDLLALHEIGGFNISQLSELTGNARETVRQRLERGRRALGRKMWQALTPRDETPWLEHMAPALAARLSDPTRVVPHHIVCEETSISRLEDIVLVLWRGPSSTPALEALVEVMFAAVEDYPGGIRYMSIIEPTSTPPTREGRQVISWGAGKLSSKLRAAAWAVEDQRMVALVAPIMNACLVVGGAPFNLRFFDGVRPAATWLTQHGALEPQAIADHVEWMRSQLG